MGNEQSSNGVSGERPLSVSDADPETWVDEHADALFGYALPRVRDRHAAADLVQETFLAAVQASGSFRGESSQRTWLIGILKRKIIDHLRKRHRERSFEPIAAADPVIEGWFSQKGSWVERPRRWGADPASLLHRKEFWEVFGKCLDALPERLAHAFSMRVMDQMASEEIRKVLQVSPTNLWVMLHRARARLRSCLEVHWFGREAEEPS